MSNWGDHTANFIKFTTPWFSGSLSKILDGEVRGDLQSFIPKFVTTATRRLSRLIDLSEALRL